MADASVTPEIHEALYVHRNFAPQITLDAVLGDLRTQLVYLFLRQILNLRIQLDASGLANLGRTIPADAEDRGERDYGVLSIGYIDTGDTGHSNFSKTTSALGENRAVYQISAKCQRTAFQP
jgi:hypothetical protein